MSMGDSRQNAATSDEIDLFELLRTLWKGRYFLACFCLLGITLAALYAFNAKEQWKSVTFIRQPRLEQISAYLDQRRAMARVNGNQLIDVSALTDTLFNSFVHEVVSIQNRLEFLASTEYYARQIQDVTDVIVQRSILEDLAKALVVERYDKNQIVPYYEISFTAETAKDAQAVLSDYLVWANDLAFKRVDESFNNDLDAQILSRQTDLLNIDFKLKAERRNRIEILENAIQTAKLAGIKDYIVGRQTVGTTVIELSDNRRLFMLGEKYLEAELQTTQKAPIIYPPHYFEMERELELLIPLREYDVKTLSYWLWCKPAAQLE